MNGLIEHLVESSYGAYSVNKRIAGDRAKVLVTVVVIVVQGSSARIAKATEGKPVDAAVIAVVDHVDLEGKRVWTKFEPAETKG